MDFLTNLFGDPMPIAIKLILLTLVLVAILLLVFWIFRKFVGSPALKAARGRQPRLAVTDAANLDDKRRLVLVRRDDVEHLVMIGGTTDILIEPNIVRATSTRPVPIPNQQAAEIEHTQDNNSPGSEVAQAGVAAGVVAASALAASDSEANEKPVVDTPDDLGADKNITTVEEIKEAAMADISLELDELDISDNALDEEAVNPVETQVPEISAIEPEIEVNVENMEDPVEPTMEVDTPEIQADALSGLENALGEELSGDGAPAAEQSAAEKTIEPEPVATADTPQEPKSAVNEKPDMEDEMQKLLDELSGEKA